MNEADNVNRYWHNAEPWKIAKDDSRRDELHSICSNCLRSFFVLAVYLAPIVPALTRKIWDLFKIEGEPSFEWARDPQLLPTEIRPYEHIFTRIDPNYIEAMTAASTESMQPTEQPKITSPVAQTSAAPVQPNRAAANTISIDDFARLDLRIGTVLECGFIDGSDKLLRFLLDAGDLGQRQIFSGIRAAYTEPEKLVGRKVVFIANLAPRKMRFGVSEGMILSAGGDDGTLFLLDVDAGAQPGMPVK
jgi:methionyl-tRNA synthetase